MKREKWLAAFFAALCFLVLPVSADADMGPKPSVTVTFRGLERETYYATLLSELESTGPYSSADVRGEWEDVWNGANEIERKFMEYEDADGFYYLMDAVWDCTEKQSFAWTYYPPERFKILLYFPEYDAFLCGEEVNERYAFESKYTVDLSLLDVPALLGESEGNAATAFLAARRYNVGGRIAGAAARLGLTLLIELAVAWLFRYRGKMQAVFILCVNVATQAALNVILAFMVYRFGGYAEMAAYILLEILIFALEAVLYDIFLPRWEKTERKGHPVLYALAANAASFGAGLALTLNVPDLF